MKWSEVRDLNDRLERQTWLQLKQCALTTIPVLLKLGAESADARDAVDRINRIFSDAWEGPGE
jgi:hypothetical protein